IGIDKGAGPSARARRRRHRAGRILPALLPKRSVTNQQVDEARTKAAAEVARCYRFVAAKIHVKASRFPAHARRIQRRRVRAERSGMLWIGVLVGLMVIGVVFAMT